MNRHLYSSACPPIGSYVVKGMMIEIPIFEGVNSSDISLLNNFPSLAKSTMIAQLRECFDISQSFVSFDNVVDLLPKTGIAFLVLVIPFLVRQRRREHAVKKHWADVCRRVRQQRDAAVHQLFVRLAGEEKGNQKHDVEEDRKIARLTAMELISDMRKGVISSERVVEAFSRRARSIGSLELQAVTQEFYDKAIAAASEIDRRREATNKGKGDASSDARVLEGIPVSIKDSIHMKGALSTCGMACKAALGPSEEDGLLVKALRVHGAIPFVRGNVPQCLMLPESKNAIFGSARNPWNLERTPGGSSGGEGSLVASRCAPIALGSDVGGSIRIPCHFTGTCGLKPTPERMSKKGMAAISKDRKAGQRIIHPTMGPIANSVDDLALAMTALCSSTMWDGDAFVPRLPWDKAVVETGMGCPLKIGFFTTDHWFEPCPTVARAIREATEGLQAAGHKVVPFEPPVDGWEVARLFYGQMGAEGNMQRFVDALQGEQMLPEYQTLRRLSRLWNWVRPLVCWTLRHVLGDYRRSHLLGVTRNKGLSVRQYYELVGNTFLLRSKWETAVNEAGLDAVIYPTLPLPALPHGASRELTPALSYTFLANLLHWPAGVVPATIVRPDEEDYDIGSLPVRQRDRTARLAQVALKGSAGLPVGVQVMTKPFTEELTLFVMREVERAVGFAAFPQAAAEF